MKKVVTGVLLVCMGSAVFAGCGKGSSDVSYDVGHDASQVPTQSVVRNGYAAVPESEPAREGYDFAGWYSDKARTKEFDFNKKIMRDTMIYGKWSKSTDETGSNDGSYYRDYYNLQSRVPANRSGTESSMTSSSGQAAGANRNVGTHRGGWTQSNFNEFAKKSTVANEIASRQAQTAQIIDNGDGSITIGESNVGSENSGEQVSSAQNRRQMRRDARRGANQNRTDSRINRNRQSIGRGERTYGAPRYGDRLYTERNSARNAERNSEENRAASETNQNQTMVTPTQNGANTNLHNMRESARERSIRIRENMRTAQDLMTARNENAAATRNKNTNSTVDGNENNAATVDRAAAIDRSAIDARIQRESMKRDLAQNQRMAAATKKDDISLTQNIAPTPATPIQTIAGQRTTTANMPSATTLPAATNESAEQLALDAQTRRDAIVRARQDRMARQERMAAAAREEAARRQDAGVQPHRVARPIYTTQEANINNLQATGAQRTNIANNSYTGDTTNNTSAAGTAFPGNAINNEFVNNTLMRSNSFENQIMPSMHNFAVNNSQASNYYVRYIDGANVTGETVTGGSYANCPSCDSRDGKTFAGWYTDSNYTTVFDPSTPVNDNMTVYAKWI